MRRRWRRPLLYAASGVVVLLALLMVVVLFFTQTNPGREQVRRFAVERLDSATDGEVRVRRLEGNLLRRAVLVDVSIVDDEGRRFVVADTISTRFSVRALLRQRIMLTEPRLVNAHIVLNQPPGERWNYERIFRIDPDPPTRVKPTPPGWGDWVELRDVELANTRVTVRTAWRPPEDLTGEERDRALRKALDGETRENVVRVPGGYQNVMDFRELHAFLPHVIPTHPDSAGIPIEVARFSGIVQPFRPPVAEVRDLSGKLRIESDSLHFTDISARLPGSHLAAAGVYALHSGDLMLRIRGVPLAFDDLRWLYPPLPEEGGGPMLLTIERRTLATRIIADEMDVAIGEATIEGRLDITVGDTLRLGDTDLRFARVDTRLLEDMFDGLDVPRRGALTGRFAATGPPSALQLDTDIRFDDAAGPASRIVAVGELGIQPRLRFGNMRLRFDPLHAQLARAFVPELPVRGTITGFANLTGDPAGVLQLDGDIAMRDPVTGLSRVRATGGIDQRDELRLRNLLVRAYPLRTDLLREHVPALPRGGTLVGAVRVDGNPRAALRLDGDVALHDPATGTSRAGATGAIAFNGEPTFDDMQLRLHEVQVDLLREHAPELPPGGVLAGTLRLDGRTSLLHVDGTVTHRDPRLGTSTVGLDGGIGLTGELRFRELDVRLEPLHMRLVRAFAPDLPLGGTLLGTATLNGTPAERIAVRGDLTHVEGPHRSRVTGRADVATGASGRAAVDVSLQPLALAATVGAFVPQAGLHGTVAGRLQATGNLSDLRLTTDLAVADGGRIRADGMLDLAADRIGYDLDTRLTEFDIAAVSWRAPAETRLTGSITAAGRGTDPATMNARLAADLADSEVDDVGADRVRFLGAIDNGLARVNDSFIRLGTAEAELDGSFGLVAWQHGELRYRIAVDSLHAVAPWLPAADTAVGDAVVARAEPVPDPAAFGRADTVPDPAAVARADTVRDPAAARADTMPDPAVAPAQRVPDEVVVADAVLGADSALIAAAAAAPHVPRDSLAGRLYAAGTLRGNIDDFAVDGRAEVEDFVYAGTQIGRGTAEYALARIRTATPDVTVDGEFDDVVVADLAFDRVTVDGRYRGTRFGEGTVQLRARQDDETEYGADVAFTLALDRNELRLADAQLRFDTVTWRTTRPGSVAWGGGTVEVDDIELVSNFGGRIFADGVLPAEGAGDLQVGIENLQAAQLATLLQGDTDASGRLDITAHIRGTQLAPVIEGTAQLTDALVDGTEAPDARVEFAYADRQLNAEAQLVHDGRLVAEATAQLPVDLAFAGVAERLLPGEIVVDVRADSLPVEAFPVVTEHVEDVRGVVVGEFTVRGTFADPVLAGGLEIDLGSVRVIPLEVTFRDVGGTLTLDGSTVTVDSVVARSRGPIRLAGTIDVSTLSEPVFDLELEARDALVIDTDDVSLRVDADLTVEGPPTALVVAGEAHTRSGMLRIPELAELGSTSVVNLDDPATFERVDTTFIAAREALRTGQPLLRNLALDIALIIDRDVWLRSPEANVEIYTPPEVGPLRITSGGATDEVELAGTINTDRGEYEFMGRRFSLTRGAVTFIGDGDLDPLIQLAAEHEVQLPGREAFAIRVVLGGTVSDLSIALESNAQPPISQTDLLSYLAFGRDATSLLQQQGSALSGQGSEAGELVGNVAAMAAQQLAAVAMQAAVKEIEAGALRDLGLDVFRITPADLPAELFTGGYGDVLRGTQVEAGRYISPRLFVAGQSRLEFRPGLRAEYWTPRGFELHAAWQPRYLPMEPTLQEPEPRRGRVLGVFLFREWRF
jgi:translocation and assembly module TamB